MQIGARQARWIAAAALVGLLASGLTAAPALAVEKYPSWEDIKNAKNDETAKQGEIDTIKSLITTLTDNYLAAEADAQSKLDDYNDALNAFSDGFARYLSLKKKADAAKAEADAAKKKAGALVAQMYRTNGTDVSLQLLLSGGSEAQDLLYKLSALGQITDTNYQIYQDAISTVNLASSLEDDAKAASDALASLEATAKEKYAAAEQAQATASAALQEQKDNEDRLYAQLADLENTTADLVKQREEGIKKQKEEEERKKRAAEAARRKAQQEAAARAAANSSSDSAGDSADTPSAPTSTGAWVTPTYGYISSGYGGRESISTGAGDTAGFHNGTDIANKCGTHIYAAAAGTVVRTGTAGMAGAESILINHGSYYTLYLHMMTGHIYVKVGDKVSKGQYIADMGMTGQATGCHLHFGVYPNNGTWTYWGTSVNPVPFLAARGVTLGVG